MHVHLLGRTIRVEELTAHVDDRIATPGHDDTWLLGDGRDDDRLDVLLVRIREELVDILGSHGAGHTLLALRDGKLGAVQAIVLLGDAI